jgi:magnesium chelatase subunit I
VQGLKELTPYAGVTDRAPTPLMASAVDFVLEGLYAQKKISRSDERGYAAADASPLRPTRREEQLVDEELQMPRGAGKKKYYN